VKVWVTGAGGFVGSNVVRVLGERHGAHVLGPTRAEVDVTDGAAVMTAVRAFAPDVIAHCAILNDPVALVRGAVHDRVGRERAHRRHHGGAVGDVHLGARRAENLRPMALAEHADDVRPDEPARAGDPDLHAATRGATCSPYGPWTVWSKSMTDPVTIRAASLSR
jgi:nucleoside-diphosphate-sugar epimerase